MEDAASGSRVPSDKRGRVTRKDSEAGGSRGGERNDRDAAEEVERIEGEWHVE